VQYVVVEPSAVKMMHCPDPLTQMSIHSVSSARKPMHSIDNPSAKKPMC